MLVEIVSRYVRPARLAVAVLFLVVLAGSLRSALPVRAAFPGVNGLIAFDSYRDGQEVYVMNADGTEQTRLTNTMNDNGSPAWSPDGMQIAFWSNRDGHIEIYVMNADGTEQTKLTNSLTNLKPTWSPDGTQIAFESFRDGNGEIYVMNADGTGQTNLTNTTANDRDPAWSPDGTKIAFGSDRDGNLEVYVMNADGTGQTNLSNNAVGDSNPAWSPDGMQIAFASAPSVNSNFDIYVMNADGTGQTNLSNNGDMNGRPAWSPDGTQIAFQRFLGGPNGNDEIYVMNADGTGQTNLTNNAAHDMHPDWQPIVPTQPGTLYVSTVAAGTTADGLAFGPHDVLLWDGTAWGKWFDGSTATLTPNGKAAHNINAVWIPDSGNADAVFSFVQNARVVPGVPGKVNGMDLVWWDGNVFSLWFDGEDVGLTNQTKEKIDALHVLDGSLSPIGGSCLYYLLISTQGDGRVTNYDGTPLRFDGTDVLGFCMTNSGAETAGFWHRVLNGKAEGMPGQALTSLSASDDGQVLYLTTRRTFNVDSAIGGHSMVYRYDFTTGEFSGPHFSAPANGLPRQVDALHVEGALP